jgi:hypothetical protein
MCRILVWGLVILVPLPAAWPQEGQKGDDNGMKVEGMLAEDGTAVAALGKYNGSHRGVLPVPLAVSRRR